MLPVCRLVAYLQHVVHLLLDGAQEAADAAKGGGDLQQRRSMLRSEHCTCFICSSFNERIKEAMGCAGCNASVCAAFKPHA